MTVSGSGTVSCCTRSTGPPRSAMSSSSSSATFCTPGRICSTRRVVNAPTTSLRSRACSAPSSEMIISGVVVMEPPIRGAPGLQVSALLSRGSASAARTSS